MKLENLTLEKIKKLPQGNIINRRIKEIPDIFSDETLEVALAVVLELEDYEHIYTQTHLLERAYKLGWRPETDDVINNSSKIKAVLTRKNKIFYFEIKKFLTNYRDTIIPLSFTIFVFFLITIPLFKIVIQEEANKRLIADTFHNKEIVQDEHCSLNGNYCLERSYSSHIFITPENKQSIEISTKHNLVDKRSNKIILDKNTDRYKITSIKKEEIEESIEQIYNNDNEKEKIFVSNKGNFLVYKEIKKVKNRWAAEGYTHFDYLDSISVQIVSKQGNIVSNYNSRDIIRRLNLNEKEIRKILEAGYYSPNLPKQIGNVIEIDFIVDKVRLNIDTHEIFKQQK